MLTIRGLGVRYGRSAAALHGIDIDVPDDGVLAVLGNNGAGKSTLLRAISGDAPAAPRAITPGRSSYGGKRSTKLDPARDRRVSASSACPRGGRSSPG